VLQIAEDLEQCKINKTEDEIKKMKKYSFKKLVHKKVQEASQEYLLSLRNDPSRSKSKNIVPSKEMKHYLKTNLISTEEKLLLFLMKSRMNNLKWNFKSKYKNNLNCLLCKKGFEESESHLLQCDELINDPDLKDEIWGYLWKLV
jgi:hypothetical protein